MSRSVCTIPSRWRRGTRALALTVVGAALLAPAALSPASASVADSPAGTQMPASTRPQSAPNVFYPLSGVVQPRDLRSYREGTHRGTEIQAPCDSTVRSIIPGTVHLIDSPYAGGTMVAVATTEGRLTTYYAFLNKITVTDGQILSAGQPIGQSGDQGAAEGCMLRVEVRLTGTTGWTDPTAWLEQYVGQPVPDNTIFGNTGFKLATFNVLGKSHTDPGGDASGYPSYSTRLPKALSYIRDNHLGVIGLQEFQKPQYTQFRSLAGSHYALYPPSTTYDTENSIAWDTSKFTFVSGYLKDVPYFNGQIRRMPYIQLRHNATGRTAWFMNVHNPADTGVYKNQGQYRARAVAIERATIVSLRRHGRPVFLTGDMNDRTDVYCQITAGKLALSANSVPSLECLPPASPWIDWVFGAGQTRFSTYNRDWSVKDAKITDHPVVWAKTYLAE